MYINIQTNKVLYVPQSEIFAFYERNIETKIANEKEKNKNKNKNKDKQNVTKHKTKQNNR